jgi:hypothetical protein
MDQQEFVPESQGHSRPDQDEEQASTYYRKSGNGPKEEHPSTFEDTVPPYVYRAQNSRHSSSQEETQTRQTRQSLTDDAASGRGNRSNTWNQQQQARMHQRMRGARPGSDSKSRYWKNPIVRWAILILFVLALLHILPFVAMVILSVLGVLAVALLLPIFILLGLVAAVVIMVLVVLALLGVPITSRRRSRYFHR